MDCWHYWNQQGLVVISVTGNMFVGALAYADDLVLIAPTPYAMRTMLRLYVKSMQMITTLYLMAVSPSV